MGKKIVVVNAGPRKGWNTDTLLIEASKGVESTGAEIERFDLFRLEKYTRCISCFGCKKKKFKGHCVCKDGLTPVLDAIRKSDGLIIGSPNYLGDLTASFRALYERLVFQNLTYNADTPCCNQNVIPVLLIMTSNSPDTAYLDKMENYQQVLTMFVGPTELFISGDTLQLKDYSKQPQTTDSYQVSCSKMYSFEPVIPEELTAEEQDCILGVQANLWTEHVAYPEHAFYQLLPRLASMSEVQWCAPQQKDFENFKTRLPQLQKFYDKLGYVYCHQVE